MPKSMQREDARILKEELALNAVRNGKVVKTVTKEAVKKPKLRVQVSHTDLVEGTTYDVASVRLRAIGENPMLRKKLNIRQVFYTALGMEITEYVVLLILACTYMSNVFLLFIPGAFIFGANGVLSVLTTVFLANSVDYGEWKNGRRDESVIFSMQTFVVKLASGVSALLAAICLAVFNISDNTEAVVAVSQSSVMGLRFTMTIFPIIGLLVAAWFFRKRFMLDDEKVQEIVEALRK